LEAHQFFFLNFKGTITREHKTIISCLKINEMTLSGCGIFPSEKEDLLEFQQFQNTTIRYRLCPMRWPYAAKFEKLV
jgi:hypothetical protein